MLKVLYGAVASGVLLIGQAGVLSADTLSFTLEGTVDLASSGIGETNLIDGEAYALLFTVDTDELASGGAFLEGSPMVEFAQSGVSVTFDDASANVSQGMAINAGPFEMIASIQASQPNLFLEVDFSFEAPLGPDPDSLLTTLNNAELTSALFVGGGPAAIGICAENALFCGLFQSGPAGIALVSDEVTTGVTPVPLPAGLWLLLSGLGLVGATRKISRRKSQA